MSNVINFPKAEDSQWNELESAIYNFFEKRGIHSDAASVVIHNTRPLYNILHARVALPSELSSDVRAQIDASIKNYCSEIFMERLNREIDAL